VRPADHTSRLAGGELADSESAERDFGGDPEGAMRRREFLERTAIAAGSAGLAGALGADELVVAAAKRVAARRPGLCPSCHYDLRASPGRCPECGAVL